MPRRVEREAPLRELSRQPAGVFVIARPFHGLPAPLERGCIVLTMTSVAQTLQRAFSAHATVYSGRPEEHDRILDVLETEPSKRLEIFGQDSDRSCFFTVEESAIVVRQRLVAHMSKNVSLRMVTRWNLVGAALL